VLGPEATTNFFNQIMKLWVNPEIESRKSNGALPELFTIYKCLITLPKGNPPIVKFNEEFGWEVTVKRAPGMSFEKGQEVYIHEIISVKNVKLPTIDGKPVAFVYFVREGIDTFRIFLDFSPNHPNFQSSKEGNVLLEEQIAELLQTKLVEQAISIQESYQSQLQKIGL
jgi:hypothetical protein